MPTWIIEPRDPFIARDGRPFGPNPGARATSLPFPYPSTTTGGVRTRAGLNALGFFSADIAEIKRIEVRGPLLVELADSGEIHQWFAPAPMDALLLGPADKRERAFRQWLAPRTRLEDGETDLPADLIPVGPADYDSRKPLTGAPRFWDWDHFESWLLEPGDSTEGAKWSVEGLGRNGPLLERRTHLGIDSSSQASIEGALFATAGLEFTARDRRRLAMAVVVVDPKGRSISGGLAPLGGERRLVQWAESKRDLPLCPRGLREQIVRQKACRLILLTPAYFEEGWRPSWLLGMREGRSKATAVLAGAAVGRAQVISGWDFETRKPKPTRRVVPAGSVFFLRLHGDDGAIGAWVDETWMQCVSDDPQVRRDGFGLAVLGAWPDTPDPQGEME